MRFTVHNYLVATNKPTGGVEYKRLETALDRLKGTTIKTTIRTGDKRVKEAFGIIDSWTIVERSPNDERYDRGRNCDEQVAVQRDSGA